MKGRSFSAKFMTEKIISVDNLDLILALFGSFDENINLIQREYNVVVLSRGSDIKISGEDEGVLKAYNAIETLLTMAE